MIFTYEIYVAKVRHANYFLSVQVVDFSLNIIFLYFQTNFLFTVIKLFFQLEMQEIKFFWNCRFLSFDKFDIRHPINSVPNFLKKWRDFHFWKITKNLSYECLSFRRGYHEKAN